MRPFVERGHEVNTEERSFPTVPAASIPTVTAEQMREVDRVAMDTFDVLLIQMMENAGARLAELVVGRFKPDSVSMLCGSGGNGGGGLVAARHIANRGVLVNLTLGADPSHLGEIPSHQLSILERMEVPIHPEPVASDLIVEALVGYSLSGDPRDRIAELIRWANEQPRVPVCSLDLPSGLNATTGHVGDPCVRATATVTLALPKTGLAAAPDVVGDLYLADISIPAAVYAALGITVGPIFAPGPMLCLV